jgi:hypothetical protein
MFVVLTLACLWLGWQAKRAREQKEVVAAIRAAGGEVHYRHQFVAKGRFDPDAQPRSPMWLRNLIGEDFFISVRQVNLSNIPNSMPPDVDAVVQRLTSLPQLRDLNIDAAVSDKGLSAVGLMTQLERLWISSWAVTDAGCVHLGRLSQLKGLELHGLRLGNGALAAISTLPRLESLKINGAQMTNDGLKYLARLPSLRGLTVHGVIRSWPGSHSTEIDGGGLRYISELRNLESLALEGVPADDAELQQLAKLTKLKSAVVSYARATGAGTAKLHEALPQTVLMVSDGGQGGRVWAPKGRGTPPGGYSVISHPGGWGY